MRENTYVRVCGHVRSIGGKRVVAAFRMTPIMDMNELTYHTLEIVYSHLMLNKLLVIYIYIYGRGGLNGSSLNE